MYRVTESYELSGVDFKPVTGTRYLTFVERGGKWLLSSDSDGAAAGLTPDTELDQGVQIWDQGPVSVVHGSRSLVIGLGGEQRLRPFADLADTPRRRRRRCGARPGGRARSWSSCR